MTVKSFAGSNTRTTSPVHVERRRLPTRLHNSRRRSLTPEEEARFARACAEYVTAKLNEQHATGIRARVPKKRVVMVLGAGFSPASVDRKWKQSSSPKYAHLYDPDFPKPINPDGTRIEFWFDELLAYKSRQDK